MNQTKLANQITLCETLDRVLNKGVVLHGDIMVSVSGVDLLTIRLRALVCASDTVDSEQQAMPIASVGEREAA
jgi:hypothetical protein